MIKHIHGFKRFISIFLLFIYVLGIHGCKSYITKKTVDTIAKKPTTAIKKHNTNFYVLHIGNKICELQNVEITENEISGNLTVIDETAAKYYDLYNTVGEYGKMHIDFKNKKYAYQIHLYVDELVQVGDRITIGNNQIKKVSIYKAKNDTVKNLLIVAASGAAALTIILLIACSCPHVYIADNGYYYFNNTLFTGATSKALERHDYKLMPDLFTSSDNYEFYIKNEEQEHQFTDLLELWVVEHNSNEKIISDQRGNIYSIIDPINATRVSNDADEDISELISVDDERGFAFNNNSAKDYSNVFTEFEIPQSKEDGKLILKVKNTEWSAHVYNEFSAKFGRYYDNWVNGNAKKSKEEVNQKLKEAGIPLLVSIKVGEEWIDLEAIDLIGDKSYNSLVIPIKEEYLNGEKAEIRIRSGFMFWKLDHVYMDFSKQTEKEIQIITPSIASGKKVKDFTKELSSVDEKYMEHLETGDSTFIQFQGLKKSPEKSRTMILHSKGYYLPQKEFAGKPEWKELKKFKETGELSRFSKELYDSIFDGLTVNFE